MKFGACAGLEFAGVLADAGFDYIEPSVAGDLKPENLDDGVSTDLQNKISQTTLRAEAYNVLLPGDLKVVGDKIDAARQDAYLEVGFERAAALGGKIVVFGSGGARRIPDGFDVARAGEQVTDFLRRAGLAAARHGLTIAIEPLNKGECNFINSVAEAVTLAEAVAHPSVGVLSDLYHVTTDGQSFDETRDAARWLRHVHVAGAEHRRAPIDADQSFLADFFRVLKEVDYRGRISVEGRWDDLPAQVASTLSVLRRAWQEA